MESNQPKQQNYQHMMPGHAQPQQYPPGTRLYQMQGPECGVSLRTSVKDIRKKLKLYESKISYLEGII